MVPKSEADDDKDKLLDEKYSSVDWDDAAAVRKLPNDVLKHYLKKHNLRSSGLNKARAQLLATWLSRRAFPSLLCPHDA